MNVYDLLYHLYKEKLVKILNLNNNSFEYRKNNVKDILVHEFSQ